VVYGVTEYGVLQKGDAKPFRLTYYPKALVGPAAAKLAAVGDPLKVEIIPTGESGKTRFQVVHAGQPVAEAEETVLVPGAEKKAVKTDKQGFTPVFEPTGRYGVFARVIEAKGGEYAGKKFEETRYYATLVMDVDGK
ncbi:MAG: Nickel uptake substrate-specific transrane region, partial [Gemmataceae bacterium]|nr:Nickel uptake substrate-specific transrane region [Gemmataceae bacterium]